MARQDEAQAGFRRSKLRGRVCHHVGRGAHQEKR